MSGSGTPPFGYKREHGRLKRDPNEAPIREKMYELYLEHQRLKTVATELNGQGYRTRSGSYFTAPTLKRWLLDERVVGIPGQVERLIDPSIFAACQDILTQKSRTPAKRKPRHVFAGLTLCHCGGKMMVPSRSKKYTCQSCKQKIYADDLEAIFVEQLLSHPSQHVQKLGRAVRYRVEDLNDFIGERSRASTSI